MIAKLWALLAGRRWRGTRMWRAVPATSVLLLLAIAAPTAARADEVLTWNALALRVVIEGKVPSAIVPRALAIVHVSMFDALNGIYRRFESLHVTGSAPRGASPRAALVYAAYTSLSRVLQDQVVDAKAVAALQPVLDDALLQSLADMAVGVALERSASIERGRQWGIDVAQAVIAWRAADGLVYPGGPTFVGNDGAGQWRPTAAGQTMLVPTMADMKPFAIPSTADFRPPGPRALDSDEYAADVNEVESVGAAASETRTADQTESARFWAGTSGTFWNRAAAAASQKAALGVYDNARLFALLNIAMADTLLVTWEAKKRENFWRPITAIRLASTDGNPDTIQDDAWAPLITTPPYPEYCSGHQSASGSAKVVLNAYFGAQPLSGYSEAYPSGCGGAGAQPCASRSWSSFAAAADEALLARVWAGIHFRSTMLDTRVMAERVAAYVLEHAAEPLAGVSIVQRSRVR